MSHSLERTHFRYTASYCEENVWHLCGEPTLLSQGQLHAVFISNDARRCPIWRQKAALDPATPMFWDYHVVMLATHAGRPTMVFDLDTCMNFPESLDRYIAECLNPGLALPSRYHPRFRVLAAEAYRSRFCSDRSHMRNGPDRWLAPPPPWPCIVSALDSDPLPLATLLDTQDAEWIALPELLARF